MATANAPLVSRNVGYYLIGLTTQPTDLKEWAIQYSTSVDDASWSDWIDLVTVTTRQTNYTHLPVEAGKYYRYRYRITTLNVQYDWSPEGYGGPALVTTVGGSAPDGTVTTDDIDSEAVTSDKIAPGAIQPLHITGTIDPFTFPGKVKSAIGGFQFPDNTIQTTAVVAPSPDPTLAASKDIVNEGNRLFPSNTAVGTFYITAGNTINADGATSNSGPLMIPVYTADWPAVTGKTKTLRMRVAVVTNASGASGITFTFGIAPFTSSGTTAGAIVTTLGTALTTWSPSAPAVTGTAGAARLSSTADLTFPADDIYTVKVVSTGGTTGATAGIQVAIKVSVVYL